MNRIALFLLCLFSTICVSRAQETYNKANTSLQDSIHLEEIVINSLRPVFSAKGEEITLHVAETTLSEAGTARDILQKTSKINVDERYGVFVGLTEATIYIDGKEVTDTNVLNMLSSREISKVDIISNPSIKYDSKARAIIEITTRKGGNKGTEVEVTGRITKANHWNEYLGAELRSNISKLSLYTSYTYAPVTKQYDETYARGITGVGTIQNDLDTRYRTRPDHRLRLGGDYLFSENHSAGAELSLSSNRGRRPQWNSSYVFDADENEIPALRGNSYSKIDYTRKYKTGTAYYQYKTASGLQVRAVLDVSRYDNSEKVEVDEHYEGINLHIRQRNKFESDINTFRLDAAIPLGGEYSLQTGLKYTYKHNSSESLYAVNEQENTTYPYNNKEKNGALYALFAKRFDKLEIEAGARLEFDNSFTETDRLIEDTTRWNIFPSMAVNYNISKDAGVKFSYIMSTHRPTFNDLNPSRNYVDSMFYMTGNPSLVPEKRHNLNLKFTYRKMSLDFNYTRRNNAINWFMEQDPQYPTVTQSSQANIERSDVFSINFLSHYFNRWMDSFFATGLIFTDNKDEKLGDVEMKKPLWYASVSAGFKLPYDLKFNINCRYFTKGMVNVFFFDPVFRTDLTVRKSFLKNKLVVTCMWNDVFRTDKMKTSTVMNSRSVFYSYSYDQSLIGISLNYKFATK